jgi:hypothetical protein
MVVKSLLALRQMRGRGEDEFHLTGVGVVLRHVAGSKKLLVYYRPKLHLRQASSHQLKERLLDVFAACLVVLAASLKSESLPLVRTLHCSRMVLDNWEPHGREPCEEIGSDACKS